MDGILLIIFIFFLVFAALLAMEVFNQPKSVLSAPVTTGSGELTEPMDIEM